MSSTALSRARRWAARQLAPHPPTVLQPIKMRVIDAAARRGLTSIVDLGGVWAVEAGYTFWAIDAHLPTRAVLVDTGITDTVRRRAESYPTLELIDGNFGEAAVAKRVGNVDTILMFDVLVHQVRPDWNEVLEIWAPYCQRFAIVQPQWIHSPDTVRLLDLGEDEFRKSILKEQILEGLFDRLDEIHPKYDRPWRDVHEIWQWGITDSDLKAAMDGLGFDLVYFEDEGPWMNLERFDNRSFLFERR